MILLITPSARAQECAQSIQDATGQSIRAATSLQEASTLLRTGEYETVVIDQFVLEAEPDESDQLLEHLGTATPVYINFAVTGMKRLVREVQLALHRREVEERAVVRHAQQVLQNELKESVTAMLLSCDMVMAVPGVPETAMEKIRVMHELACEMSTRLGGAQ